MADTRAKLSKADYERLGRMIDTSVQTGFSSHYRLVKVSMIRGMAFGFGSVIGGTVILALVLWILTLFGEVPFIGEITEKLRTTIE